MGENRSSDSDLPPRQRGESMYGVFDDEWGGYSSPEEITEYAVTQSNRLAGWCADFVEQALLETQAGNGELAETNWLAAGDCAADARRGLSR